MNALNRTSLKVAVCGTAALALTSILSWTFVDSNMVLHMPAAPTHMVASNTASHLAQATATGLLE